MKFEGVMIIAADIEKSKQFYVSVLNEKISVDLGTYVIMGGGFSIMARETWTEQTKDSIVPDKGTAHCFELYFEESEFDAFVTKIRNNADVKIFQPLTEAPWGQRTIRFLDPDGHVVEVSEPMNEVILRSLASGMTEQEVSERSMMPIEYVRGCVAARDEAK